MILHLVAVALEVLLMSPSGLSQDSRVYSLVYQDVDAATYDRCIRLLNGTKQIGCQSSMDGDVGILFHLKNTTQIDTIKKGPNPPYIVILQADMFNKSTVKSLSNTGNVNGMVIYSKNDYVGKKEGWTPELQCPRYRYGLYNATYGTSYANCNNPWNPMGDGLLEEDIGFPVFVLKDYAVAKSILECHDKNNLNKEYPFCAAEMKSRMFAAQSTEACIRRNNLQNNLSPMRYCDEIGGYNLLAYLRPTNSSDDSAAPKPIILVTSSLDSRSFEVPYSSIGANAATGFITLLATSQALGELDRSVKDNMGKDIMFLLFDGEAFDNTGSSRVVYDMMMGKFPYEGNKNKWQPMSWNISNVEGIVELGQVGLTEGEVVVHFDPISYKDPHVKTGIDNMISALKNSSTSHLSFREQSPGVGLVPSSMYSFLRSENVSGVVLTDFDNTYRDKYYFSRYDTLHVFGITPNANASEMENVKQFMPLAKKLSNISTAIAQAVYQLASGNTNKSIQSNSTYIANFLYCYLHNTNCSFFQNLLLVNTSYTPPEVPLNRYVGTYTDSISSYALFPRNFLAFSVGEQFRFNATKDNCKASTKDGMYGYFAFSGRLWNLPGAMCYRAPVYSLDGRSPSTVIENYDYANGFYTAWSESVWSKNAFNFRIFLVQDSVSQGMMLLSGLLMLLSSLVIMYIVSRKSAIMFNVVETL